MMPITNNLLLNTLADRYATAIYNLLILQNGGEWFAVSTKSGDIRIDITGGAMGIRDLVNSYLLLVLKHHHHEWEPRASSLLDECLEDDDLTNRGHEIWNCMLSDIEATLQQQGEPN